MLMVSKWTKRTASSTQDYINGIKKPRRSWGKTTCEAADCYKKGVDAAHSQSRFRKGVKRTGRAGYLRATITKGPTRFAQGVIDASKAYERGYKPYHAHFPSIFMPKRFPRGDPRNIDRVGAVSTAMGRVKTGMAGTGKVTCPDR